MNYYVALRARLPRRQSRMYQSVEHVVPTLAGVNNIKICSNTCRGARRPRRPPRLEQRSAASANCSKPPRIAQNHSKSLKTAQNRSKSLKMAQLAQKARFNRLADQILNAVAVSDGQKARFCPFLSTKMSIYCQYLESRAAISNINT